MKGGGVELIGVDLADDGGEECPLEAAIQAEAAIAESCVDVAQPSGLQPVGWEPGDGMPGWLSPDAGVPGLPQPIGWQPGDGMPGWRSPDAGVPGLQPTGLQPGDGEHGLQPGEEAKVIEALADAAANMRSVGQHALADYLDGQMKLKVRAARKSNCRVVAVLAEKTKARKRKIEEARKTRQATLDDMKEKAIDLKIATENQIEAAHAVKAAKIIAHSKDLETKLAYEVVLTEAKEKHTLAKKVVLDAKSAKTDAIATMQAHKKHIDEFQRQYAGQLAGELEEFVFDKPDGVLRRQALSKFASSLKGKTPWKKAKALPYFWDPASRKGLRCISPKNIAGKYMDPVPVFASESFSWIMWGKKSPTGTSQKRFVGFVDATLPGYKDAIGPRFPAETLLKEANGNADIAFLRAVWYYSSVVPEKLFPCGLRTWPPVVAAAAVFTVIAVIAVPTVITIITVIRVTAVIAVIAVNYFSHYRSRRRRRRALRRRRRALLVTPEALKTHFMVFW